MNFLYPGFLYALVAVLIPVIIHLFNFRRFKKVYFSNVRFLREVKEETQSRSRLRHLLVLLTRMLAIAFLVLAFAQPYIPLDDQRSVSGNQAVSIYLDNSFSMDGLNTDGRLFDIGKQYAYEIARSYEQTDVFQLLTNDFEGRHQRLVNREDLAGLVDEATISPAVKSLSEVIARQKQALAAVEADRKTLFLISDFQRQNSDLDALVNDTNYNIRLIPITPTTTSNLYIDSCWFESPVRQLNVPQELGIRVRNSSDKVVENVPVKLTVNGQQKALASFSVAPNSYTDTMLVFTTANPGMQQGRVSITDHPVTFDDHFYFSYTIAPQLKVMVVDDATDTANALQRLYGADPYFSITNMLENRLDYSTLPQQQLIILNGLNSVSTGMTEELKKFVANGGSLLVFPGTKLEPESYQPFLETLGTDHYLALDTQQTRVAALNTDHAVYRYVFESVPENIDLPVVQQHFTLTNKVRTNRETLLELRNGQSFLEGYGYGKGKVYLSAVPLEESFSNFSQHAIFVPTLYNIALFSQPGNDLYFVIGDDGSIELSQITVSGDNILKITNPESGLEVIPEQQIIQSKTHIFVHNQIREAGNYGVSDGTGQSAGLAFNYERAESDLRALPAEQLQESFSALGLEQIALITDDYQLLSKTIQEISRGKSYWEWCIVLTLLFLGIEVLLLKFWR